MVKTTWTARLWTAFFWVVAALEQVERVVDDFKQSQVFSAEREADRLLWKVEDTRPVAICFADVHFLAIAVTHLGRALDAMGADGPKLDKALRAKAVKMRHLSNTGRRKSSSRVLGKDFVNGMAPATIPTTCASMRMTCNLGPETLSLAELARELRRVERELIELDTHGRPPRLSSLD